MMLTWLGLWWVFFKTRFEFRSLLSGCSQENSADVETYFVAPFFFNALWTIHSSLQTDVQGVCQARQGCNVVAASDTGGAEWKGLASIY